MVDGTRVAVWGQGYGGGAAAALAADDARNVTRCLAVIAPLTDLRHHSKENLFNSVIILCVLLKQEEHKKLKI